MDCALDKGRESRFFVRFSINPSFNQPVRHSIMALKIRLQRGGSAHNPVYRIVVAENTSPRDGRFVEVLGTYAPKARGKDPEYRLKLERADYWAGQGAKPTETVAALIRRARKEGEVAPVAQ